jgi:hypothetical protein
MKNLTGALVFSLSLLFTTGCPKNTGASPDRMDPLATDTADSGTSQGALQGASDGGSDGGSGRGAMGASKNVESCVDRWLEARKLDRYGHEAGTMYAGGTPLFNEATGEARDRVEYIFERHPEARAACTQPDAGAGGKGR